MDPIISIVSGTYNRISYLQAMVNSVRRSVTIIPYEIIIVDGGSTDGSIEWCKKQQDIVLIEQGKLMGAIKAFNAGACAASGVYTILANDDIEFIDESITCAFTYMQDNPNTGCGCFWQDRGGKNWHVDQMPAIGRSGNQLSVYYGQVAIYPTWLGNLVGWWGDYNHTYGGDNELSCNIHELGYSVVPLPCACIHDNAGNLMDELRKKNNQDMMDPKHGAQYGRTHPDSARWLEKWRQPDGKVGAKIGSRQVDEKDVVNIERVTRILYAPIFEPGHPIQKSQKRGLKDALSQHGLVFEHDYMEYGIDIFLDIATIFKPDIIITQIQNVVPFTESHIRALREENPNAILINWNGDYHPDNLYNARYMSMLRYYDKCGFVTTSVAEKYDPAGINWFYWQIGYEESDAKPLSNTPKHDILFLGNGYSAKRQQLARTLKSIRNLSIGLYGSWSATFQPNGNTLYDFDSGRRLYGAAKIAISDSQWPDATGFVSNRLFQALESEGALLLQQWFEGCEGLLGLKDREHLVIWYNLHDMMEKIQYYLNHEDERKRIVKNGAEYVRKHHSFEVRVKELFDAIK